jgi:hypothetical protein
MIIGMECHEQIDQFLPDVVRAKRNVFFLLHDEHELIAACAIDDIPDRPDRDTCRDLAGPFIEAAADQTGLSMSVALTRPGSSTGAWFHTVRELCARHGIRLDGVFLAPAGRRVREVFPDDVM